MKKILPGLALLTVVFAACNTSAKTELESAKAELEILKAKQATIDSMNAVAAEREEALVARQDEEKKTIMYAAAAKKSTPARRTTAARRPVQQYSSYSESASLPTATVPEKKKGWSNKAKGAVIGGVVGAGAGAVISKEKKVQGAVIGGVLGAGAGYGVGAILDKKAGR